MQHGKASTYRKHGCRCELCTKAQSVAVKTSRNRAKGRPDDAIAVWVSKADAEAMSRRYVTAPREMDYPDEQRLVDAIRLALKENGDA